MFNEPLFLLSFSDLRNIILNDLTILHIALVYVLMYVIYKALGRYVYFKPQEHASKINRTFLVLSLLTILLNFFSGLTEYLPFLPEYKWLYMVNGLVILIALPSIIMDRIIWKYNQGHKQSRSWHYSYLPIPHDYYETNISKSKTEGSMTHQWEEKGVESTNRNIHSDALLNVFALVVFMIISLRWAYESTIDYNWSSLEFSIAVSLPITGLFIDRGIFSWIKYLDDKYRAYKNK